MVSLAEAYAILRSLNADICCFRKLKLMKYGVFSFFKRAKVRIEHARIANTTSAEVYKPRQTKGRVSLCPGAATYLEIEFRMLICFECFHTFASSRKGFGEKIKFLENSFKGRSLNLKVLGSVPRVGIAF